MKIGFIGVGNMGGPMCRNIIRNTNHQVVVHDLDAAAVARCTSLGATAADSIAGLAGCEVVFTSLPIPEIVERVIAGPGGLAETAAAGTVVIDLSTNSPETAQAMAAALGARGIAMLEALAHVRTPYGPGKLLGLELVPGALAGRAGQVRYPAPFTRAQW